MTNFSVKRKLTDYTKVQLFLSNWLRGKRLFIKKKRIQDLQYLDIGCGTNNSPKFVNLDYRWTPQIDVCWDIVKKALPFPDNKFKGVYTEHCFEHIPFESFKKNMHEIYRVLAPGGTLRLIMPDGEIYLDIYQRRKQNENVKMPYEDGYISPMHRINGIFRNHGHLFIYDFETVRIILEEAGFKHITKQKYKQGRDAELLRDTEYRSIESLYVEAVK